VHGVYEAGHHHDPEAHGFCGVAAEVEVDVETGMVTVRELLCVADVGTVINPQALRGQIVGGCAIGLGHALTEELRVVDGRIENVSLADYKLPTAIDVPPVRLELIDDIAGPGPFGSKMAGEISTAVVAPAIANAIAAACGARVTELPLTSERVFTAIQRGRNSESPAGDS
jgi:CO/xanthine dehydrogenase Mo-binding subunit